MTQIEQILAEIDRLRDNNRVTIFDERKQDFATCQKCGAYATLGLLRDFIYAHFDCKSESIKTFKVGDRIRIKGSGAIGDIITNIYKNEQGDIMYEFQNSDDRAEKERVWELVQEPVSEDLEKELESFIASGEATSFIDSGKFQTTHIDPLKIARHFAQWQKEQMMKDAVEGGSYSYKNGYVHISCDIDEHLTDIKMGDKVKVIILPSDNK